MAWSAISLGIPGQSTVMVGTTTYFFQYKEKIPGSELEGYVYYTPRVVFDNGEDNLRIRETPANYIIVASNGMYKTHYVDPKSRKV